MPLSRGLTQRNAGMSAAAMPVPQWVPVLALGSPRVSARPVI